MLISSKPTLKIVAYKMAFSCCFSFKGDLDFLDFLLKSFITSTTGHHQKSTTRFRIKLKILDTVSSDSIRWRRWCCAALHTSTKNNIFIDFNMERQFCKHEPKFSNSRTLFFQHKKELASFDLSSPWRCVTLRDVGGGGRIETNYNVCPHILFCWKSSYHICLFQESCCREYSS